ncbi:hypothetical protein ACP0AK_09350 [Listeria ivanovii]|uniref:Uncharacterized protein n=1 Tax=Listeria ivanovii (strain ATCC BAA-678 / PAM 55) TaxID=881621 RepID=G2Z8W3_LISIP|nr:hypothetical protein [Listeria ivanovii]MBC1760668.1 hypothetical protein [Listeria ivanovii]MBK3922782.1 hypothetical protein [Listeria ivanovii subsp. ivanovii]MBK3927942.1 hypothetical protein [Listeria ivanovii subsp. ivanovii]MCJ1718710.1 hypothetical protein [Listeria ivanovii]MCJ1723898.1 hypothetical protein [Listeria ivanovii]
MVSTIIIICSVIFALKWVIDINNIVEMVKVEGVVYVVTTEPGKKKDALDIEHKIKKYLTPEKDFTSTELNIGTELYAVRNEEDFPRNIY